MARKKSIPEPETEQELMEHSPASDSTPLDAALPSEDSGADMTDQRETESQDSFPLDVEGDSQGDTLEDPHEENGFEADDPMPDPLPEHTEETDEGTSGDETDAADSYDALLQELGDGALQEGEHQSEEADSPDGDGEIYSADDLLLLPDGENEPAPDAENTDDPVPVRENRQPAAAAPRRQERVLTIDARGEVQTEQEREATIWHEVQNAYRTRRILTGTLDGVEKTESGLTLAIVNYKGFRVAIPLKEMLLYSGRMPANQEYLELMARLNRMLSARLGSEIDFIVKGIHNESRSIVASRKDAMYRKRKIFYMDTDELGEYRIYEGRIVQARVIAVAEKVIRVEVFGVECSILARDLSWEWVGNARDHYNVGDRILVRVQRVDRSSLEDLTIHADVRSVSSTTSHDNLKKCLPQCRYAGRVTDVRNGVVFIRLNNGVNAIAHSCYDLRTPGKKDDVSFAVTRLDEEQGVAIGIITRIIKQNL